MNIVKFFQERELSKSADLRTSKNSKYENSETLIKYIKLDTPLEDTGQEHLVLSRSLADSINDGSLTLKDAEVRFDSGTWGVIRPDGSASTIVDLW